jgi:hypothetical protein
MKKGGQVTIFIIVGIILLAIILLFFLVKTNFFPSTPNVDSEKNPGEFLRTCLEDSIRKNTEIIMHQGGYINNPLNVSFPDGSGKYYDSSYLCYNRATGKCVNQQPDLIGHVQEEIHNSVSSDFRNCFASLVGSLTSSGYIVKSDSPYEFESKLISTSIQISTSEKIELTKNEQTRVLQNVQFSFKSKTYELLMIARKIVEGEMLNCEVDYNELFLMNPKIDVEKFQTSDGVEIYTLTHRETSEWFRFVVRGCVR